MNFRVRQDEVMRIDRQECVEAQRCGPFVPIAKYVPRRDMKKQISSFGRERRIQLLAKALLIGLMGC